MSQRSKVRIPYNPFSGFLFVTAKVASITAMIYLHVILHPAVHIYDFHIFITSSVATLLYTPTSQFITITWEAKVVRLVIHDSVLDSLL